MRNLKIKKAFARPPPRGGTYYKEFYIVCGAPRRNSRGAPLFHYFTNSPVAASWKATKKPSSSE